MKKIMFVLMMTLLVLTACSSTKTVSSVQDVQDTTEPAGKVQSSGTQYEAEKKDVKTETIESNDKNQKFFVPVIQKQANKGESVTFGAVVNSMNKMSGTFVAKVVFIGAKDLNSNPIETDKNKVLQWLNEGEIQFNLEEDGYAYFPITVIVGNEIKSGVTTPSGNYQYEVKIYSRKNGFDNEVSGMSKEIYVRVP